MGIRIFPAGAAFLVDDAFTPPRVVGIRQPDGADHYFALSANQQGSVGGGLVVTMPLAGNALELTNNDPATLGVAIRTKHGSPSPAANDYAAYWNIYGNDSGGNETLYGYFQCLLESVTDGSERGLMYVGAGGGSELRIGQGVHTSGAAAPGDTNVIAARQIKTQARTVAQLPAAATVGAGTRGWVSDSNVAYATAAITNAVVGGGANGCPVYSDGTTWRIG